MENEKDIKLSNGFWEVELYISCINSKAAKIEESLLLLLRHTLKDRYSLKVINITDNPESAYRNDIIATPTLLRIRPEPRRRIIGDLSDQERVLQALGIESDSVCV